MSENKQKKILIIDDDPMVLYLLVKVVHRFLPTSQKFTAQNKKDALILLEEQSFDMVISDFNLPDGDGTQILSHPSIKGKKVGISGQPSLEFQALCDQFISKPFDVLDFSTILDS
jgi:CheY-like chemotaxis protein